MTVYKWVRRLRGLPACQAALHVLIEASVTNTVAVKQIIEHRQQRQTYQQVVQTLRIGLTPWLEFLKVRVETSGSPLTSDADNRYEH